MPAVRKYQVILEPQAISDLQSWQQNKPELVKRISRLLDSVKADPFSGIGKPKALRYDFEGLWSRRIDKDHRIVYEVIGSTVYVLSLKGHYGDK